MHSLLARQINKYLKSTGVPPELASFLRAVNEAYEASDNDRKLLEHALEISSKEMIEIHRELRSNDQALRGMVEDLKKANEEIKQAHLQLLQSEKMAAIGQLAAGVAHEINNPVGFISNNMEVLEEYIRHYAKVLKIADELRKQVEAKSPQKAELAAQELKRSQEESNIEFIMEDIAVLLEHSRGGLERIKKIVMDLRMFAREDKDKSETMEPVKVEVIMDSIWSIVYNELKYKAELVKEYGDTPLVQCNAQRIGQVFINLLLNASQAIENNGKVTVRTYQKDGHVCVEVADTGSGIAQENLSKVFDPFFTTKPVGQGTGLGLTVSHEIIKKHNGDIKVESKLGRGTTFTVRLPLVISTPN